MARIKKKKLYTVNLKISDVVGGKIRIETETSPEVINRALDVSPAVDLAMWLQQLIVARLKGKPSEYPTTSSPRATTGQVAPPTRET